MTAVRRVVFNGKFCAGGMNGVHRVAGRLVREIDTLIGERPSADDPAFDLIVPAGCGHVPDLRHVRIIEDDWPASQMWEQWRLPKLARGAVLVNLANLSPILHRRKVTMLHDAQFCRADSSYPWRQRLGYRLLTPLMARSSARVLTVSAFARDELKARGILGNARCTVLPNGADHILDQAADAAALGRLGLLPGGYALLFGSAKAYKNNRVVFAAFADGALAPLRLVVVGPDRAALERAGLEPPGDAVFAGPCDDAALRALYENAHALLFPSLTEGFGLPPVEAMACGCPAIVSPCGAMPEVCGAAAATAAPDDPAAWAAQVRALYDPARRAAQIDAGLARARGYTWARTARSLLEIVRDLARDG
ncbi:MAG: hypothetical protein RIS94_2146 [Pseudomonadota bacterium]